MQSIRYLLYYTRAGVEMINLDLGVGVETQKVGKLQSSRRDFLYFPNFRALRVSNGYGRVSILNAILILRGVSAGVTKIVRRCLSLL